MNLKDKEVFMCEKIINSIGLCFDIIGAMLVWIFGLPPDVRKGGYGFLIASKSEKEAKKATIYNCFSILGMALLILGFILQLMSNIAQF